MTKLDSIEYKIEESLVKKIRWIATMRNGLMHKDGFEIPNFSDFDKSCKEVIENLNCIGETTV